MSPTLENLKTLYNSFEKENGRNFFNKFYDYFSFVKSKPNLNNKIVAIEKQKQENDRKIENLEFEAIQEVLDLRDKIKQAIPDNLEDTRPQDYIYRSSEKTVQEIVTRYFFDIDELINERLFSSMSKPTYVVRNLVDILEILILSGNEKPIKQFVTYFREEPFRMSKIKDELLKNYLAYENFTNKLSEAQSFNIEGSAMQVLKLYNEISIFHNLKVQEGNNNKELLGMNIYYSNWLDLQKGQSAHRYVKSNYINNIERLHNYLMVNYEEEIKETSEALKPIKTITKIEENITTHFDPISSFLWVNGQAFKINKFTNTYYFLEFIFKQNYEEIILYQQISDEISDTKYINTTAINNAIYQLKLRLKEFNFDDLFLTSSKSVSLNPKYF